MLERREKSKLMLCLHCHREIEVAYNELCFQCYRRIGRVPARKGQSIRHNRELVDLSVGKIMTASL